MKKYSLVILLFLPLLAIAQSNYKSGYVINLNRDTLRGYIDYKEWGHNPKSISFKPGPNDKARSLGLPDINYFEINGYISYRKYQVSISLNQVDISSPTSVNDTASATAAVFLKILQTGKNVTLYAYRDEIKERFYIQDNGTAVPTELLYGIYQEPNSDKIINRNTYRSQLSQLVIKYNPAADKLIKQVQQSAYVEDDLIQIAEKINGNVLAEASQKSKNNPKERFFVGGAFISSTIKDGAYYGSPASTSGSPKITIGIDLIANPDVGHLIFRLELGYASNNYSFTDMPDPIYNAADPDINLVKAKQNVIFITPQVIYNIYNADMLKVFAGAGYSINILPSSTGEITETRNGETLSTTQIKGLPNAKGDYSSFQFKAGVVLSKRFEVYGAYFPGAQITDSYTYSINLTSYQIGINYFLGKTAH